MSSNKPKGIPVSEVFDNLVVEYRTGGPPHSVLFQTALRVCAEDSKRVQRGEPPSALRALVQRAHVLIKEAYPSSAPASLAAGAAQAQAESVPVRFAGRPPSTTPFEVDEEAASAAPGAAHPTPGTAPSTSAADPFRPVPALGTAAPGASAARPASPAPTSGPTGESPFDNAPEPNAPPPLPTFLTLDDAPAARAPRPVSPVPPPPGTTFEEILPAEEPVAATSEPASPRRGGRVLGRIAMVGIALLAAAVAVVILWPGVARRQTVAPRIVESFPAPTPTVPAADLAAALRAPARTPPPAISPTPAPAAAPTSKPAEPRAAAPTPRRPVPAEADAGVETMRSPDWSGRSAVYVVHFSSYRSHANAVADAARLASELGRPAHAVVVELGEKGTWYRVVVGEFATPGEARAFRAEVAARRPGEVSSVFRLAAP